MLWPFNIHGCSTTATVIAISYCDQRVFELLSKHNHIGTILSIMETGTTKHCPGVGDNVPHKKDVDLMKWVQKRAVKMVKGLKQLFYEDRLRELERSICWKEWSGTFQCLKGICENAGEVFITCTYRTRANGFKLKKGRFRLDMRNKFFTMRMVKH